MRTACVTVAGGWISVKLDDGTVEKFRSNRAAALRPEEGS